MTAEGERNKDDGDKDAEALPEASDKQEDEDSETARYQALLQRRWQRLRRS